MKIVLIANNSFSTNCYFEDETNIEIKKKMRPLSLEGEKLAKVLAKDALLADIERIYSDPSAGSIISANYLAERLNQDIIINKRLGDCRIGDLKGKTIKMLSYFQEHDFSFKLPGGESLHDCGSRIVSMIRSIINEGYANVVIYLPKRCLMAYLINHTDQGFNLDERLVLSYHDEVILDNNEEPLDICILSIENKDIVDIQKFTMED